MRFARLLAMTAGFVVTAEVCARLMAPKANVNAQLRAVGQVHALGGDCREMLLDHNESHLLTRGALGDLVYWDVERQLPLRSIEPRGRYVTAFALHASEPWALVGWSAAGDWTGSLWHVDLVTGTTRELASRYVEAVGFDDSGEQFNVRFRNGERDFSVESFSSRSIGDARLAAQPPSSTAFELPPRRSARDREQPRRSRDARHKVEWYESMFHRSEPAVSVQSVPECSDLWVEDYLVTNAGTILAWDWQGQVHFLPLEPAKGNLRAPHRGAAHQLIFSPDGNYLAIVGLGAVRVVDLEGHVVQDFDGTHLVTKGAVGADFWLCRQHDARRWNASSRRDVAPPHT